ncbi:MAG: hypothetical protein LAT61_10485 [Alcanivorax sp.]|nr:hypothetical protein [Alcanivorax sp.]
MKALFCIAAFLSISTPCFAQSGFFSVDEHHTNHPEISPGTINPAVIGENAYSEEGASIIEREYQLNNAGDYLYVKRKYELMPDGNYKLIWRSPESVTLDAAICKGLGHALSEDEVVTIISPDALYPVSCGDELQNRSEPVSPAVM